MRENPNCVVRQADGDDLSAVLAIGHRTWPDTFRPIAGDDYVQMGLAKWWTSEELARGIRAGWVNVAEVDGEVVGMTWAAPHDGALALWRLYVLPEHQGSGAGSALMARVLERAALDGYPRVVLSYLDGNDDAARFCARWGFTPTGREESGAGIPDSIWIERLVREEDAARVLG